MPTVASFNVPHVKGFALEHPDAIELTETGVAEDRRFFLVDETGRLVDGLLAGRLVQVAAWTDPGGSTLRMTFPDGSIVEDEVRPGEAVVTRMYGRTVYGRFVDGPWLAPIEPFAGRRVRLVRTDRPGGTRTEHQTTLVGDGSLARLGEELGADRIDGRRFRMLIELAGAGPHEEDDWIGGLVTVGEAELRISAPVPRCAITTHDPSLGVRDLDLLRAIKSYRGLRAGYNLDFGVWGEIERPGRIRIGDEVVVRRTA
jgi:uncharacterized protein YcbX